jgi:hypothetical protein
MSYIQIRKGACPGQKEKTCETPRNRVQARGLSDSSGITIEVAAGHHHALYHFLKKGKEDRPLLKIFQQFFHGLSTAIDY